MAFDSFDAVFYTVGFLIPGFVWSAVLSMLVPRRVMSSEVRLLEYLTFSCLNHGLWSWALFWIFRTAFIENHPYWGGLVVFGIVFLSPVVLGVLTAYLQQREMVARFLGRLGFRTIHPIPMAWDWLFSQEKPYWALVTLKNGSRLYGLYGLRSYAGSDPERRDLYLEAMFRVVQSGDWAPVEDTAGVLVMANEIAAIELKKLGEVNYD